MGQIIYKIVNGSPNFTISLQPGVLPNQVQTSLGIYSFDNVPDGYYTLTVIDNNGCRKEIPVNINIYPCILEGVIDCYFDCTLEAIIDCDYTTTTTSTTEVPIIITTTTTTTGVCDQCPQGYTAIIGGCYTEESIAATIPTNPELLVNVVSPAYGKAGAKFYKYEDGEYIEDENIPVLTLVDVWQNQADWVSTNGPLNRCGVWSTTNATTGQYIGFGREIIAPETKVYYIGIGADNYMTVEVNSIIIKSFPAGDTLDDHFRSWHLFPVLLYEGSNLIHLIGYNDLLVASIGAEVYNATYSQLQAVTTVEELEAYTIFSTKDSIGTYAEEGNLGIGYTCPEGYTLINRQGVFSCDRTIYLGCGETITTTTTIEPM